MAETPRALSSQQLWQPFAASWPGSRRHGGTGLIVRCQNGNGSSGNGYSSSSNGYSSSGNAASIGMFANDNGKQKTRPNSEKPTGVGSDNGSSWKAP